MTVLDISGSLVGPFGVGIARTERSERPRHAGTRSPEVGRIDAIARHDQVIEEHSTISLDEAMTLVRAGDRAAFAIVYDALAPILYGAIKRVLRDPAMSEEVTQDVFLEIWRTAPRFDASRSSVSTWAITIARRRAIDRVRREQSRRDRTQRHATQVEADTATPLDEEVASGLEAARVRSALASLPEPQREVIRLAFIDGRSHGEIAERLDLPLGTVKGRVRGGLRRLRAELEGQTT